MISLVNYCFLFFSSLIKFYIQNIQKIKLRSSSLDLRFRLYIIKKFSISLENSSLSVHVTGTGVIWALLATLTAVHFAVLADKVLVLLDVVGLEADAEQVVPELAFVTLDPVNL